MTLWCMGRCGDPSGREPLRERIWSIETNDIGDLYLAALVLGELDAIDLLAEFGRKDNSDIRRAISRTGSGQHLQSMGGDIPLFLLC